MSKLTNSQYKVILRSARERHDLSYEIDHPRPSMRSLTELTGIERAINYLWLIWAVLAVAGALISLPHTLNAVLSTVHLPLALAVLYSIAVFIGVEMAVLGVSLVSALAGSNHRGAAKQSSLAGLVNDAAARIGLRPIFNLSHLPDRQPPTGAYLVALLFLAAMIFNMADSLRGVTLLAAYTQDIHLIARLTVGALGPSLLLISGHRFAHEIVRAATRRQRLETTNAQVLEAWTNALESSWSQSRDTWIAHIMAEREQPRPEQEQLIEAIPLRSNGNGHIVAK